MKPANSIFADYGTTVFEVVSARARERGAINLGQGFPENLEPDDVVAAAADALHEGPNQYPPLAGLPELRRAVAAHDRAFHGLDHDPDGGVLITTGASEALAAAILALIEPGDEAVVFEPLYDTYVPMLRRAGATPRVVRLDPPDWTLDPAALDAAMSDRTKLVILNSPHNPTGRVFQRDALEAIRDRAVRHDAYVLCDEVYEHLVFGPGAHEPLMALPGAGARTLRVGSAGKVFSLTGWKVGWLVAEPGLLQRVAKAHQFLTFTVAPNLQRAVAYGLQKDADYFAGLTAGLERRRDRLAAGLDAAGFRVLPCPGTYFLMADFSPLGFDGDDVAFCQAMVDDAGVAAVPASAFYRDDPPGHLVRFCFAKDMAVLDEAAARLHRAYGQ